MREIITLQVGQCGNQVASQFWESLCEESGIDAEGRLIPSPSHDRGRLEVFFQEIPNHHRFIPRTVLVDMEPGALDVIRSGQYGELFSPDYYVFGQNGAGNNWAKGYYTEGAELIDNILDCVRRQSEACDCLQGFQLFHSLGGGTGSGLGTLVLSKLREEFPDRLLCSFSVIPSPKVSDSVVEPYNTTLAMHQLIENSDISFTFDNEALYDISLNTLKQSTPTFRDLNALIAKAMIGISSNLRYPGQLNCDYRKLAVNLVPFPRLHFLMISHAPLLPTKNAIYRTVNDVHDLTTQLFHPKNMMCAANPMNGKYLTCAVLLRGRVISNWDIEHSMQQLTSRNSSHFVDWIPNHVQISLCNIPPMQYPVSATMLGNNTAIQEVWRRISEQANAMLHRKAFLHWYTTEGMEEVELIEADSNIQDLMHEYLQYQEADAEIVVPSSIRERGEDDDEDMLYTQSPRRTSKMSPAHQTQTAERHQFVRSRPKESLPFFSRVMKPTHHPSSLTQHMTWIPSSMSSSIGSGTRSSSISSLGSSVGGGGPMPQSITNTHKMTEEKKKKTDKIHKKKKKAVPIKPANTTPQYTTAATTGSSFDHEESADEAQDEELGVTIPIIKKHSEDIATAHYYGTSSGSTTLPSGSSSSLSPSHHSPSLLLPLHKTKHSSPSSSPKRSTTVVKAHDDAGWFPL